MDDQKNIKPMAAWESGLLLLICAALGIVCFYVFRPALEATGLTELQAYFLSLAPVFLLMLAWAWFGFIRERHPLTWQVFSARFRLGAYRPRLLWVGTNGFQPLLTGYNRSADNSKPDEVAYDEGSEGVGPGVNLNNYASLYYKIVNPGAPGVPAVITGDQYIGNNIYGVVVTPEVPKRPNLQAASMNGRVILSWAASASTMNYVIRRSDVNGGPYTDIATQATPGYTDSSVVNGQTYYYVVAAEGPFGTNVSLQVIGAPKLAPESLVATGARIRLRVPGLPWLTRPVTRSSARIPAVARSPMLPAGAPPRAMRTP